MSHDLLTCGFHLLYLYAELEFWDSQGTGRCIRSRLTSSRLRVRHWSVLQADPLFNAMSGD